MLGGVAVHCLERAAMNRKVRLPIAIQIQGAQLKRAGYRLLEDPGIDRLALVQSQAWQRDIQGNKFQRVSGAGHIRFLRLVWMLAGCKRRKIVEFSNAEQKRRPQVCSNRLPFYKIVSLLPAVPRCKQGPSDF